MIQVAESACAADRLAAGLGFIERHAPASEVLIVGASRDAADDLARLAALRSGTTFGIHRYSLIQLAAYLALESMAGRGRAAATALGKVALAARVTFEALRDGALRHYAPVASFPGFPHALAATLTELRLAAADPRRLTAAGGPARDVAELLRRFEVQLEDGVLFDTAALLTAAAAAVEAEPLRPLLGTPMVLLDVPLDSPAHRAFVAAVTARSPAILATMPRADAAGRQAMAGILRSGAAVAAGDAAATQPRRPGPGITRVHAFLFAEDLPPHEGSADDVALFSAPGEGRESVEIARRMLDEARAGTRFDQMAVFLRAPRLYAGLLETALARAGIPVYFAGGTKRPDPAGRAFLALIDCAVERLSATRFAEYLSLGQVPDLDAAGQPGAGRATWMPPDDDLFGAAAGTPRGGVEARADGTGEADDTDQRGVVGGSLRAPWKWEAFLVESTVIGGRERWSRRLDGLAADYRLRLEALRQEEPDSPHVAGVERALLQLEHLRAFALPVIDRLAALPAAATWGAWIDALEPLAPLALRRPERVLAVLAQLRPLAPIDEVPLDEVRRVLAAHLLNLEEPRPPHRYGRVFVATPDQARGRAFEIVFVPGLAERVFPHKPREDPLLLDDVRRAVEEGLETQEDRSAHERVRLALAAGAATRRLYVSYSRVDVEASRARVASFYALEVARALTGAVPDPDTLERAADAAGGARLAWPAPADAGRAIDEPEHDLATLRSLLALPPRAARGRARYLLELNASLGRSLRGRWERWRKSWQPSDGIVRVTDATREALAASRLTVHPYSVSALQKFAVCPYQFFLSAICRITPRPEIDPLEQLDPLVRGRIFHRVQAELMRALRADGELPLTPETLRRALGRLDRVLEQVAAEYHERLCPAIERVWRNDIEALGLDLRMWLERTAETQSTWEPVAFELAFGLPPDPEFDPRSVRSDVICGPGFRLRGVVDLVERRQDTGELRVTDHKTGRSYAKPNLVVGGGESLQPVLYSLAAERVLDARVAEARLFFATRAGEFDDRVVAMTAAARRRGVDVMATIEDAVAQGFLPPAPRDRACAMCDFRTICGPHEERRVGHKDRVRLAPLTALRSWA